MGRGCGTLVRHSSAVRGSIVAPVNSARSEIHVAVQPDPYFALPSLYGAPAYSRPPRPPVEIERPFDPDDLPISMEQTEEERRLAAALVASGGGARPSAGVARELPGGGDPGYRASGTGEARGAPELLPRRLSLRVISKRVRPRG